MEDITLHQIEDPHLTAARRRLADYEAARQLAREPGIHKAVGGTAVSRVTPIDIMRYTKPPTPLVTEQTTL